MSAMVLQVLTLMPLRTVMNYQYRYGTAMTTAVKTLYADGGWTRYYQGLTAALIQGPVARFGDTAANAGILALLSSNSYMKKLPKLIQTVFASLAAAGFRMILMPVDAVKTTMQTDGKAGLGILRARVRHLPPFPILSSHAVARSRSTELARSGMVPSLPQRRRSPGTTPGLAHTTSWRRTSPRPTIWGRCCCARHS